MRFAKPFRFAPHFFLLLLSSLCLSLCYGQHIDNHHRRNSTGPAGSCLANEREALLQFKLGLRDTTGLLSSWSGMGDCCKWRGVVCDKLTGHIVKLDIRCTKDIDLGERCLQGAFNSALLNLEYLEYLDVSRNNFIGSSIPNSISSVTGLKHLDVASSNFSGSVPSQLGKLTQLQYLNMSGMFSNNYLAIDDGFWLSNLTALRYLDLSSTTFSGTVPTELGNLTNIQHLDMGNSQNCIIPNNQWISRLAYLTYLDVSGCTLEDSTISILQTLNMLPLISEVYLSNIILEASSFLSISGHLNITSLSVLDISYDQLNSTVPRWLSNITTLQQLTATGNLMTGGFSTLVGSLCKLTALDLSYNAFTENLSTHGTNISRCKTFELQRLDISYNQFTGFLPDWLAKHQKLKSLRLNNNAISGPVPEFLGDLMFLQELDLSTNKLTGNIPSTVGQLGELTTMAFSSNSLQGTLSDLHFSNLTRLVYLDLSLNSLELNISDSWVPFSHLKDLNLISCKMRSRFPLWIQRQDKLVRLNLGNTGIYGTLPTWIWNFSSNIQAIGLSGNNLYGSLPDQLSVDSALAYENLSSNNFEGELPRFYSSRLDYLDMSHNSFSGWMRQITWACVIPSLKFLSLSSNKLTGAIPPYICSWRSLEIVDIAANNLTGVLPNCLKRSTFLNLAGNHLSGSGFTPNSSPCSLVSLHLNNNNLSGTFPWSLQNCNNLAVLDLGENKITGVIPDWLAQSLPNIKILRLRTNLISGSIPSNLPLMSSLQVIDLANNNLFGEIPRSFGNFGSMKYLNSSDGDFQYFGYLSQTHEYEFFDYTTVIMKKQTMLYNHLLSLVTSIDLSNNKLSSKIPSELGSLALLMNLNLSGNYLTGRIPEEFNSMRKLESLDLSMNKISGEIPASLSTLTSLTNLNLSFNNLSGSIPTGKQFSTFVDRTIYMGNPYLCGFPLEICDDASNKTGIITMEIGKENNEYETGWILVGMVFGFVVGFWVFYGTLIFNRSWKYLYFEFIDEKCAQLYRKIRVALH